MAMIAESESVLIRVGRWLLVVMAILAVATCTGTAIYAQHWAHAPGAPGEPALWLQEAGPYYLAGFRAPSGETWTIRLLRDQTTPGVWLIPASGLEIGPPAPAAVGLTIAVEGETLHTFWTWVCAAGTESGSTVTWTRAGAVVGTGPTYAPVAADRGAVLTAEVTPRSSTGAVGLPVSLDFHVGSGPGSGSGGGGPPAGPPPVEPPPPPADVVPPWTWPVPDWWPQAISGGHPRCPGPVRGPHPAAGSYLSTLSASALAAHLTAAAKWDPLASMTQTWSWGSRDVVVAWLATGDVQWRDRALAALSRGGSGRWWLQASAFLADHFWDEIPSADLAALQAMVFAELDAHRSSWTSGSGWGDKTWEGWSQAANTDGFVPALIVWHEPGDPGWQQLLAWWGERWYADLAPWRWRTTVGDDPQSPDGAAWPAQTYWQANEAPYLLWAYLCLSVATGHDHFREPELGGWFGRALWFVRHRTLPDGADIGWHSQSSTWRHPEYEHALTCGWPGLAQVAAWLGDSRSPPPPAMSQWRAPWGVLAGASSPPDPWPLHWWSGPYATSRTGWTAADAVVGWTRGDAVGHHLLPVPALRYYGRGTSMGGGGLLVGAGTHYGYGSDTPAWHGSLQPHLDGVLVYPSLGAGSATTTLWGGQAWTVPDDGGPNWSGNPWGLRVSQTAPRLPDAWQDYGAHAREYELVTSLGRGEGQFGAWEALDWTAGYRDPGPGQYHREGVNRRPTRLERWVRVVARVESSVVVVDDVRPLPHVVGMDWQVHLGVEPAIADGLWAGAFAGTLTSGEGGFTAAHALDSRYRVPPSGYAVDARLRVHSWTDGAPTPASSVLVDHGIGCRPWGGDWIPLGSTRQQPLPAGGHGWPETVQAATVRIRIPGASPKAFVHVFTSGEPEVAVSLTETSEAWLVTVGGREVEIDRGSYAVVMQ